MLLKFVESFITKGAKSRKRFTVVLVSQNFLRTNDVSPSEYTGLPPACDMTRASSIVSKDFVMKNFLVTKLKKKSMAKGMVMADQ